MSRHPRISSSVSSWSVVLRTVHLTPPGTGFSVKPAPARPAMVFASRSTPPNMTLALVVGRVFALTLTMMVYVTCDIAGSSGLELEADQAREDAELIDEVGRQEREQRV